MTDPFLTMLWWTLVPAALAALFYGVVKPESQSLDLPSRERLGPPVDVTAERWEQSEASRLMVEDACARLHKYSAGQRFTARRGEDYSATYDIPAREYLRLLDQDPDTYE